jgi:hypothetical protein
MRGQSRAELARVCNETGLGIRPAVLYCAELCCAVLSCGVQLREYEQRLLAALQPGESVNAALRRLAGAGALMDK